MITGYVLFLPFCQQYLSKKIISTQSKWISRYPVYLKEYIEHH